MVTDHKSTLYPLGMSRMPPLSHGTCSQLPCIVHALPIMIVHVLPMMIVYVLPMMIVHVLLVMR